MANLPDIENTQLQFAEAAAPGTPAAGVVRLYAKADGLLYFKDDAGTEYPVYVTNAAETLTTKGDILTYTTALERLAVGTNNKVLQAASGEATGLKWVQNTRGLSFQIFGLDLATTLRVGIIAPCALLVTGGKLSVGTAPTGADLQCDVHKNGTTIFTTQTNRPIIASGETSAVIVAPDVTSVAQGDYIEWQIDQIGSTIAGKDLSGTLYCEVV